MKVVGIFLALIALGLFAAVVLSTLMVVFIIAVGDGSYRSQTRSRGKGESHRER